MWDFWSFDISRRFLIWLRSKLQTICVCCPSLIVGIFYITFSFSAQFCALDLSVSSFYCSKCFATSSSANRRNSTNLGKASSFHFPLGFTMILFKPLHSFYLSMCLTIIAKKVPIIAFENLFSFIRAFLWCKEFALIIESNKTAPAEYEPTALKKSGTPCGTPVWANMILSR